MDETLKKERAVVKGLFNGVQNSFFRVVTSHSDAAIVKEIFSNVKEGWSRLQLKQFAKTC